MSEREIPPVVWQILRAAYSVFADLAASGTVQEDNGAIDSALLLDALGDRLAIRDRAVVIALFMRVLALQSAIETDATREALVEASGAGRVADAVFEAAARLPVHEVEMGDEQLGGVEFDHDALIAAVRAAQH